MVIAIIILSILLMFSLFFNWAFRKAGIHLLQEIDEICAAQQELAFLQGDIDIPEEEIARKFLDAILVYNVEKATSEEGIQKIIDISSYEKNHLIGLTYLVQPQMYDELHSAIDKSELKDKIKQRILQEEDDLDETDLDFLDKLISATVDDEVPDGMTLMTQPLLPHCTVYQLKDGRWLWRQES